MTNTKVIKVKIINKVLILNNKNNNKQYKKNSIMINLLITTTIVKIQIKIILKTKFNIKKLR